MNSRYVKYIIALLGVVLACACHNTRAEGLVSVTESIDGGDEADVRLNDQLIIENATDYSGEYFDVKTCKVRLRLGNINPENPGDKIENEKLYLEQVVPTDVGYWFIVTRSFKLERDRRISFEREHYLITLDRNLKQVGSEKKLNNVYHHPVYFRRGEDLCFEQENSCYLINDLEAPKGIGQLPCYEDSRYKVTYEDNGEWGCSMMFANRTRGDTKEYRVPMSRILRWKGDYFAIALRHLFQLPEAPSSVHTYVLQEQPAFPSHAYRGDCKLDTLFHTGLVIDSLFYLVMSLPASSNPDDYWETDFQCQEGSGLYLVQFDGTPRLHVIQQISEYVEIVDDVHSHFLDSSGQDADVLVFHNQKGSGFFDFKGRRIKRVEVEVTF